MLAVSFPAPRPSSPADTRALPCGVGFGKLCGMTREEIESKLKDVIVSALDLEDLTAADIVTDAPLFGEGLGLDSIDALELGMAVKKTFGVTFASDPAENKKIFYSVKTLADYVEQQNKAAQS